MKLVTHNLGCNLHQAATFINDFDLAKFVLVMDCLHGTSTIVVFRVEDNFDLDTWFRVHDSRARNRRLARENKS